jgi:3-phenylpropionate/cinnamic acid dioxygenase small subunit
MSTRDGIQQTLARYALGYDENDFDLLADCFAEDAVIFFPAGGGLTVRGRDAIRAKLKQQRDDRSERDEQARHVITNLCVLEESAQEARVVSFFVVVATGSTGVRVSSGWYHDRLADEDGLWRFKERTVYGDSKGLATISALAPPPIPPA